ncbi:MAG: GntR family transcriptional regulator [Planctomycetes bacterium]|nr:GntR family transcriptional regulator [Planctomycetota bacterium]
MPLIEHQSLCDLAYDRILDEILSGQRAAGEKLGEESLAAYLGISRTPAREAMQRLIQDGIIEHKPRCGCFVKTVDHEEMLEAFACREKMECLALEEGFESLDQELLQRGLDLLRQSNKPHVNKEEAQLLSLEADDCMHRAILECCANRYIVDFIKLMQKKTAPFRRHRTYQRIELTEINKERGSILRLMLAGKKAESLAALRNHIKQGIEE